MASSFLKTRDGGWGWFVVVAAFIANFISDGIQDSFGVLLPSLLDEFKEKRSKTAWIGSVLYGVPLIFGPFASFVTKRIGYRKSTMLGGLLTCTGFTLAAFMNSVETIIITYGLIAGIGLSLPYLSSVVIVATYFKKRRTLASAIAESGAGFGTFVMAILTKYLINQYGWRGSVLVVSGISLNIVACGAVYREVHWKSEYSLDSETENMYFENEIPVPENKISTIELTTDKAECKEYAKINTGEEKCLVDLSIFQNKAFLLFTCSVVTFVFWTVVPLVFTVDRAKQLEIADNKLVFLVPSMGITGLFGNICYGLLSDYLQMNRRHTFGISFLIAGIVLCCFPLFHDFAPNILLCSLYGLFSASEPVLTAVVIIDILGLQKLNTAFGLLMFIEGIAMSTGPPFAGWLYDISGSYDNTFYSAGICIVTSGVLMILSTVMENKPCRSVYKAGLLKSKAKQTYVVN